MANSVARDDSDSLLKEKNFSIKINHQNGRSKSIAINSSFLLSCSQQFSSITRSLYYAFQLVDVLYLHIDSVESTMRFCHRQRRKSLSNITFILSISSDTVKRLRMAAFSKQSPFNLVSVSISCTANDCRFETAFTVIKDNFWVKILNGNGNVYGFLVCEASSAFGRCTVAQFQAYNKNNIRSTCPKCRFLSFIVRYFLSSFHHAHMLMRSKVTFSIHSHFI